MVEGRNLPLPHFVAKAISGTISQFSCLAKKSL